MIERTFCSKISNLLQTSLKGAPNILFSAHIKLKSKKIIHIQCRIVMQLCNLCIYDRYRRSGIDWGINFQACRLITEAVTTIHQFTNRNQATAHYSCKIRMDMDDLYAIAFGEVVTVMSLLSVLHCYLVQCNSNAKNCYRSIK